MRKRPLAVTVIAWIVIVLGCLGLAGSLHWLLSWGVPPPRPPEQVLQLARSFGSAGVTLLCGLFLLRGANGARWAYLLWNTAWLAYDVFHGFVPLWAYLSSLAILLGMAAALFNPSANAYFKGRATAATLTP